MVRFVSKSDRRATASTRTYVKLKPATRKASRNFTVEGMTNAEIEAAIRNAAEQKQREMLAKAGGA